MNHNDEIIFEQYFPYRNLTIDERNFIINLIINSKEVDDSEISINNKYSSRYGLDYLSLIKDKIGVRFEGIISNENETRMINGYLTKLFNKYTIYMNVYRCSDVLEDEDKEYSVIDEYVFKNSRVVRKTRYTDGKYFEADVDLFNEDEMEEYIQNKTDQYKLKR